jgi:hypothetical protein
MKARKDKRTTVSLAWVVWEMAEEMMREKGFNENFSAYVADLIRRDKERAERQDADSKGMPPLATKEDLARIRAEFDQAEAELRSKRTGAGIQGRTKP